MTSAEFRPIPNLLKRPLARDWNTEVGGLKASQEFALAVAVLMNGTREHPADINQVTLSVAQAAGVTRNQFLIALKNDVV